MFYASQILASIAFLIEILLFQFKGRATILICLVVTCGLLSAHYFLLGQSAGGLLILLSATRYLTAYFSKAKYFMWLFSAAAVVLLCLTYQGLHSFLPFAASVSASFASFQSHDRPLRLGLMFATLMWLIYDLVIWSPMGMALESFSLASNLVGYWRFYLRKPEAVVIASS